MVPWGSSHSALVLAHMMKRTVCFLWGEILRESVACPAIAEGGQTKSRPTIFCGVTYKSHFLSRIFWYSSWVSAVTGAEAIPLSLDVGVKSSYSVG